MDASGVRKLYEKRQGRVATDEEVKIIQSLTVKDCVRIWEDLAFSEGVFDLSKYIAALEPDEPEEALPPHKKKIRGDIKKIQEAIIRIGKKDRDGLAKACFRDLRNDQKLKTYIDSVAGTCRLGRKQGMLFFSTRDLVVGKDDDEKIAVIECEESSKPRARAAPTTSDVKAPSGEARALTGGANAAPKVVSIQEAPGPGTGRRLRGGSIKDPVTEEEVKVLCQILGRLKIDGYDKITFGVLRKDGKVKEQFATKLPAVCGLAKRNGKITFATEDLWPEKDDAVEISLS